MVEGWVLLRLVLAQDGPTKILVESFLAHKLANIG
jgi:hypothetical protein